MKSFLIGLALILSPATFASGKFTVTPTWHEAKGKPVFMYGFGIYEFFVGKKVALNSWTGKGESASVVDLDWYQTKNGLDIFLNDKLIIGGGYSLKYLMPYKKFEHDVYAKASIQLW